MTVVFSDDLRAVVKLLYDNVVTVMNVYHYEAGTGVSDTEANVVSAIATHLDAAYDTLRDQMNEKMVGNEVEVLRRNPATNKWTTIGVADFTAWSGDDTTDEGATGVAAVVRFHSVGTGRQSRKFLGVLSSTEYQDGVLFSTTLTALGNYATLIDNTIAVSGGNLHPQWWSEVDGFGYDMDGGFTINTIPGYQRRRKLGVGI